jgi:hypothetical protein
VALFRKETGGAGKRTVLAAPGLQYSLRNKIKNGLSLDGQPTVASKLAVLPRRTDRRRMLRGLGSTVGLLPVWRGKPLYQSYLMVRHDLMAEAPAD